MGNNHSGISLQSNEDCSYHIHLGKSAAIQVSERKVQTSKGKYTEEWTALYNVHGRICKFGLTKVTCGNDDEKLSVFVQDNVTDHDKDKGEFRLEVEKAEGGRLKVDDHGLFASVKWMSSKAISAGGGITETIFYCYGVGRKGLVVIERKKRSRDENPYMVTVAHYFAISTGYGFDKTDIGLSVMVTVRGDRALSGDRLGFAVEGPVQHPAAALFFMFDQVIRTGIWMPNACPHCADRNQRQRSMYLQSDSEDSDGFTGASRSLLSNSGVTKGNGNGNFFVNKLLLGRRGRQP